MIYNQEEKNVNEKKISKKLIAILCTLIAVAIIIIAFVGIYVPKLNKLKNIVPDATYSSEISGAIEYRLSVDNTEEEKEVFDKEYRQKQQQKKQVLTEEDFTLAYRQHVKLFYGTVGKLGVVKDTGP